MPCATKHSVFTIERVEIRRGSGDRIEKGSIVACVSLVPTLVYQGMTGFLVQFVPDCGLPVRRQNFKENSARNE
jgi:hypothetical protein